jgi:hypothetical protein
LDLAQVVQAPPVQFEEEPQRPVAKQGSEMPEHLEQVVAVADPSVQHPCRILDQLQRQLAVLVRLSLLLVVPVV